MHFLSLKKHNYKHLIDVTATPQKDYRKAPTFQGAEQGSAQNRTEQSSALPTPNSTDSCLRLPYYDTRDRNHCCTGVF